MLNGGRVSSALNLLGLRLSVDLSQLRKLKLDLHGDDGERGEIIFE